jgi:hypothetical protein
MMNEQFENFLVFIIAAGLAIALIVIYAAFIFGPIILVVTTRHAAWLFLYLGTLPMVALLTLVIKLNH